MRTLSDKGKPAGTVCVAYPETDNSLRRLSPGTFATARITDAI